MVKTTSDEIYAAALRLFAEKGYKGASIGAIEEAVGLAPRAGGFYRHFSSKEDILLLAMDRYSAELIDEIEALKQIDMPSPREEMEKIAIAVRNHAWRHRHLRVVLRQDGRALPKVRARIRQFNQADAWLVLLDWTRKQLGAETVDDEVRLHTFQMFSLLALVLYLQDVDERPLDLDPDTVLEHWLDSSMDYLDRITARRRR